MGTETIEMQRRASSCRIDEVIVDCASPSSLARFWAGALGYDIYEEDGDVAAIEDPDGRGPAMCFQRVPESKALKNRIHFDLNADDDLEPTIERLVALGATRLDWGIRADATWVVLADPEGNEFCVVG